MKYRIVIEKRARKFIRKQPADQIRRIMTALAGLPEQGDIKAMKGAPDVFRLRVGDYRILFKVEHELLTVIVIDAGNRGQIYK